MNALAKVQEVLALPWAERNDRIRKTFRHRAQLYLSKAIYSSVGYWLNRRNWRYMIEYRPDAHFVPQQFADYLPLFEGWVAGNRHNNCGDLSRFYTLYLNVNQILSEGVPGDFIELGVYKGNSASLLAAFARRRNRRVYLFDTFSGFDARDLRGEDREQMMQFTDTSLAAVQKLVGIDGVTYVPGFFPESATKIAMPEQIAVAHIDCDLYEPMKAALEWFYPRLSPGGILLLHDYSSGQWPGATHAIDEFFRNLPEKPILVADKSGTAIVRKVNMFGHVSKQL